MLLTDGTVIVHDSVTVNWFRLTPDNKGDYDTPQATWAPYFAFPNIGGRPYAPLYFVSAVLANAQVIVEGGEYINGEKNIVRGCPPPPQGCPVWSTKGAIIDPRAMNPTWVAVPRPAGWGDPNMQNGTGDAQSAVMSNTNFLLANSMTRQAAYYTPANNPPWTAAGTAGKFDINDEEGWNLLPDGTLLTVDAYVQQANVGMNSEIYDPVKGTWASAGNTKALIPDVGRPAGNTNEVGPAVLRPDGTVIYFGASTLIIGSTNQKAITHNAVYNWMAKQWTPAPTPGTIRADC